MTTQPGNPASSSERAALRQAIAAREAAKERVGVASKSAERGKQLLREAQHKLEQFGDVGDAILKHRTASFKSAVQGGPKPSLALPDDLVRRERARDEAAASVSAAKAAHGSLVGDFAEAQSALRKAESRVSELAAEVLVAETAARGRGLAELWNELWATIDALNALGLSLRVKLPSDVVRTLQSFEGMDHRQFPGNRNAQLASAVLHWRSYHAALCASADATGPNLSDDGVSPAAVERVA
jgi:hypothetical protein